MDHCGGDRSWFSEISLFPGLGHIARYRYTPGTGHYTQMVWSSVTRVGCGYITYRNTETQPLIARWVDATSESYVTIATCWCHM